MKDYDKLRKDLALHEASEPVPLEESFLRKGVAIAYGSKVKQEGDKAQRAAQAGRSKFDKATREKELERKVELIAAGLEDLSISLIYIRRVLGNMTGVGVSSILIQDKQSKIITAIKKGLKIR
jgi:hypothetical protein